MAKRLFVVAGTGFVVQAVGLALGIKGIGPVALSIVLCAAGIVIFSAAVFEMNRKRLGHAKDERSRRVGAYSGFHSWFLTYVVVLLLFMGELLDWFSLTPLQILGIIMATMILSMVGAQQFFLRRGDVE